MKDKEKDKRLLIPKDAFEEEASEGLGRLSREEAEEDLRELKGRMERRLRRPLMIWLPAAAAVVIVLVASAVYVSMFRERDPEMSGVKLAKKSEVTLPDEEVFTDTALIAMAEPVRKSSNTPDIRELRYGQAADGRDAESKSERKRDLADAELPPLVVDEDMLALNEVLKVSEGEIAAEEAAKGKVVVEQAVAEEVIVEPIPMMKKTAMKERAASKDEVAAATTKPSAHAVPDATAGVAPVVSASRGATGVVIRGVDVSPETRPASPVGGYDEFTRWLQENARYSVEPEPGVRQEVVVTFRVRADSTVYELKAERTAGDPFTLEAFRLIREGPKWVPAMRNGQAVEETVRVVVPFR